MWLSTNSKHRFKQHEGCCTVRFERIVYGAYFRQASYKDVCTANGRLKRILHVRSPPSAPFSALSVATLLLGVPPRILPEFAHLDLWTFCTPRYPAICSKTASLQENGWEIVPNDMKICEQAIHHCLYNSTDDTIGSLVIQIGRAHV